MSIAKVHQRCLLAYTGYTITRLAAKADVKKDMKTRARKKDDTADEKFGDIPSVEIDDDHMSRTNFGDQKFAEPSAPTKVH